MLSLWLKLNIVAVDIACYSFNYRCKGEIHDLQNTYKKYNIRIDSAAKCNIKTPQNCLTNSTARPHQQHFKASPTARQGLTNSTTRPHQQHGKASPTARQGLTNSTAGPHQQHGKALPTAHHCSCAEPHRIEYDFFHRLCFSRKCG